MIISGKINQISNLTNFVLSFLKDAKNPDKKTHQPAGDILIKLVLTFEGAIVSFLPPVSFNTKSKADGSFTINVPDAMDGFLKKNPNVYLLAYRQINHSFAGINVQILEPVYRCQKFDLLKFKKNPLALFFAIQPVPDNAGITQEFISKMASDKIKEIKQAKFSGTVISVKDGKISFHTNATAKGFTAVINFNIVPQSDVSFNLDQFLRPKIKDMDIDMPGPDFLANCISPINEDEIEKMIHASMNGLSKNINAEIKKTLIATIAKATKQKEAAVKVLVDALSIISFTKFRYPITGSKEIKLPNVPPLQIGVRSIVPELSIGFPRKID